MLASGETKSSDPIDAGSASHEATPCRSEPNIRSARLSRLAANFAVFHRQVSHVPDARRQIVAAAISLYVLRDNLFHVGAEKPLRSLLVGVSNLLVERSLRKLAAGALL